MTDDTYYDILGVAREASAADINQAFREKALRLHPDKNRNDPDAVAKFKALTQAYQVLSDMRRRAKYDAELPPLPVAKEQVTEPSALWLRAADLFFQQSQRFTPAVDAMRVSTPLTIEDNVLLIVGMPPDQQRLIGYIESAATHNQIRRILSDLYGTSIDFRVITGSTLQEWERLKAAEEKVLHRRKGGVPTATVATPPSQEPASPVMTGQPETERAWDDLLENLMRAWAASNTRSLPQTRARFTMEQVAQISRTEDIVRAAGHADDTIQRNIARALDRVANLTGIDSGTVALEYLRYRARITGGIA